MGAAQVVPKRRANPNGETVTYTPANKNALKSYINDLRGALGMSRIANPGMVFKTPVFGRRKF
ncbi:MAG: hypothetical protein COA78_14895 [Blastopirellula sp.]|nr:MAG: hypothetical protein COA78_14895 [Blastopirellula sp.]